MDLLKIILSALIPFVVEIYKGFKLPDDGKENEKPRRSIHVKIIERIQASKVLVATIIVFFSISLAINYLSIKKIAKVVNTRQSTAQVAVGLPPVDSPGPTVAVPTPPVPLVISPATNAEINALVSERFESLYGKCAINCKMK